MRKTRSWLPILLALVLVFSLSFSAFADGGDITSPAGQANQYTISPDIASGSVSTDTLYIGTVADYLDTAADGSTTVFENGEAIHPHDIIIMNNKVGIVLAVGTRNPWGYPSGSILDAGRVNGAVSGTDLEGNVTFGRDTVWSVEFLMNGWDSWSPNNSGVVTYELVNYNFQGKKEAAGGLPAVKVSRVFEEVGDLTFDVVTYYSIEADKEYAYVFDTVKSNNDKESPRLSNRFSITNKGDDGGAMADLGLLTGINTYGITDRNVFATTMILPGKNTGYVDVIPAGDRPWSRNGGSVGYKELRANYTYAANEFRVYDGYLFIDDQADTREVIDFLNTYHSASTMSVTGTVYEAASSLPVANPVVIVKKGTAVYGWFIGEADGTFNFDLPQGDYTIYAERDGYAKGASQAISNGASTDLTINAGQALVEVTFNVEDQAGNPLWARVEISGLYPVVRFTGDSVFYAEDENSRGEVKAMVPPGEFAAKIFGEGYYFYSAPVTGTFDSEEETAYDVEIDMQFSAPEGWISTDPHHHTNKNDAFAMPEDVIKSLLAAGVDVGFTTDHDFTTNNYETYTYAEKYGMLGYIPSEEISASWAHFNVIPQTMESYEYFLDEDQENNIMDQFAEFKVFVKQTHDAGAIITANHPYYSYGLFYTNENSQVPGGYDNSFDTIEINACSNDKEHIDTINKAAELWSAYLDGSSVSGEPVTKAHYLLGASDTHDVLYPGIDNSKPGVYNSGKGRTYVFLGDTEGMSVEEVGLATGQAIAKGYSYASLGPILTPKGDVMFGKKHYVTTRTDASIFKASVDVESLNGIDTILLLSNLGSLTYTYNGQTVNNVLKIDNSYGGVKEVTYVINEAVTTSDDAWFAIMVIDSGSAKMFAVSNPFWVNVVKTSGTGSAPSSPGTVPQPGLVTPAQGGTITDKGVKIAVLANAIRENTNITVNKVSNISRLPVDSGAILVSDVFEITKDKSGKFSKPVTITLPFDTSMVDREKFEVAIYWFDENKKEWVKLDNIKADFTKGQISGDVDHFTKFAVIATEKSPAAKPAVNLKDIQNHWAKANIEKLISFNAIQGYVDETFKPNNNITRAEFATILVKAFNLSPEKGAIFADTANHWAKNNIATAAAHGILSGYSAEKFGPNDPITREQMAVMIAKAAKLANAGVGKAFADKGAVSTWAADSVNTVVGKNIMAGYEDNTFKPQNKATRAEAASVIVRALGL